MEATRREGLCRTAEEKHSFKIISHLHTLSSSAIQLIVKTQVNLFSNISCKLFYTYLYLTIAFLKKNLCEIVCGYKENLTYAAENINLWPKHWQSYFWIFLLHFSIQFLTISDSSFTQKENLWYCPHENDQKQTKVGH